MKKKLVPLAGIALLMLPLAGCVVDDSATDGEGGGEGGGRITVACGNVEELCEYVLPKFTEETGIEANFVRLSGGEILARLESNAGAEQAEFDVWWGGPSEAFEAGAERDLLAAYDSPAREAILPELLDDDGYWSGYSLNPNGICVNRSAMESLGVDLPESWAALADPALRQNVATSHPATAGTGAGFVATIVANDDGDEDKAFEYLRQLHPNVLQYTKSGAAPVQMLVRGEVAAATAVTSVCERERLVNGNDDIVMTWPEEGVGFEVGAVGIVNGAKNTDGAQAFVDWALSKEAYQHHSDAGYYNFSPFIDSSGVETKLDVELEDIPISKNFDPIVAGEQRTALAERFDQEIAPAPVDD